MTALEIIRHVQTELRLPQSSDLTDPHARLILSFINKVQRSLMLEAVVWDELKVYGSFDTEVGNGTYTISTQNGDIDTIRSLTIKGFPSLVKKSDAEFREMSRIYSSLGRPLYYRHFGRTGGSIIVELLPVPDDEYQVDTEVIIKPPLLVNATDVPLLDPDTIILGALMFAKKEQGEDYSLEQSAFQAKLAMQADTQGESNFGDVEAV